ncbi:MAG: hypothetical protein MJ246_00150 [Clostridia bacterium]|nr:hypothetical protein [Clostridia bacterium]
MQGYYYSGPTLNTVTETDHGVPVNIVLTETSEIVPIPDKLTISDVTNNSFEVLIDKVDPTSYAQKMLNPIDTYVIGKENGAASELKNEAKYEIVIAQNQNLVNDILNGVKPIKTSKENKIIYLYGNNNSNFFTYDGNTEDIQKAIDVNVEPSHQITNNNNVTQTGLEALDKVCIDYLRLGYAIVFRTEARHLKLNGLDNNQMYYIGARTALHVEDQSTKYHNQSNAIYDITSTLSKIYYQITGSDIVNPTDDERIPATPENFELYNVEDKSITVRWLTPLFREEEGIDYGFELVRVEGSELSDTDNDSKRKMIEIASGDYSEFGGYRLFTKDKDTTQKLEK